MMKQKLPAMLTYWRVDEVIECLDMGGHGTEVTSALLAAMPDAYGGEVPGEDDWPEPDSHRDAPYKLSRIWADLDPVIQGYIADAAAKQ